MAAYRNQFVSRLVKLGRKTKHKDNMDQHKGGLGEEGGQGTFLETSFEIKENAVRFWLKNQNSGGEKQVWRYQHYESYASYQQKRATLMACLRKVQKMASDRQALERSAWDKIVEFRGLGYPRRVLRTACNYLGATTGERGWFEVRDHLGF